MARPPFRAALRPRRVPRVAEGPRSACDDQLRGVRPAVDRSDRDGRPCRGGARGFASGAFETSVKLAAGLVRAEGTGDVTKIHVDTLLDDDILVFVATLHVDMQVLVRVSGVPSRYTATGKMTLLLRPLIDDDLSIVIDVPKVSEADVSLKLRPSGAVASIIDQLGSVEEQVRREIVRFVNKRKDAPDAQRAADASTSAGRSTRSGNVAGLTTGRHG